MRRRDRLGKVEPVTSVSLPSNAFSRHTSGHPKNGHTQMHTLNSPAVLGAGGEDLVDELWGLGHGGSETSDGSGEHEEVTRWSRIVEQGVGVVGGARDVSERSTHGRWRNWCRSPRNQTTTFKELADQLGPTLTEADIGTHSAIRQPLPSPSVPKSAAGWWARAEVSYRWTRVGHADRHGLGTGRADYRLIADSLETWLTW